MRLKPSITWLKNRGVNTDSGGSRARWSETRTILQPVWVRSPEGRLNMSQSDPQFYEGANWMLNAVRSSIENYPDAGGDIELWPA